MRKAENTWGIWLHPTAPINVAAAMTSAAAAVAADIAAVLPVPVEDAVEVGGDLSFLLFK